MTNHEMREMVRDLDPKNAHERGLHCCVRHPDAGGRCERTATIRMYEMLNFCPEHGEEARIGALSESYHDAYHAFSRLRNPHVPDSNPIVEDEIAAVVDRMSGEAPSGEERDRALCEAYPNPPERVREMMELWARDEWHNGGPTPYDLLLDSYNTISKMMRISFEDGEDWLTEVLEHHRQETAARAACALDRRAGIRPA